MGGGEPLRGSGSRKSLTSSPHHVTKEVEVTHLSAAGPIGGQGGRKGFFGKIKIPGNPPQGNKVNLKLVSLPSFVL